MGKLQISPEEMEVLNQYGIKNFHQLREVYTATRDPRLVNVFIRSIQYLNGYA